MKKIDETKPIRDMFEAFEAPAPDFDTLFKGEVLGDAPLHQIYQSRLAGLETKAPSFDELFAGQPLTKVSPKRWAMPLWIAVGAAAAGLALFLLPSKEPAIQERTNPLSEQVLPNKPTVRPTSHLVMEIDRKETLAQKIESPKTIHALEIAKKEPVFRKDLEITENPNNTESADLKKIGPTSKSNLAVTYERSIEEAYAAARANKTGNKREKMNLGTNLNSTNRLLSMANTKTAGAYPLQGIASNYSAGYSALQGTSSSMLRSATTYRNDWTIPENISNDILKNYDAVYSLPLSVGFTVSVPIIRHIDFITGLNYTYLSGSISGETTGMSFKLEQELHYVGLPIKIAVNFLEKGKFGAYAALGGTIEKGLTGIQSSHVKKSDGSVSDWDSRQKVYGLQSSLTAQFGVYYELNKTFNIYFEPGVSYYNPSDQPISSRTEEPFNLNLGLGLRYRIR